MNDNEQLIALCQAIRDTRTRLGFSQDTFADTIKMHRAYYSSLERGEKNITFKTLCKVASGLNINPSSLLKSAGF
ncbi:MAG: helix-turn-helix transcriptional regulator [Acinetobacter sp.]|nr:helix-turn-helix transcriptional regulator [Candidatus Methylopumilus sp.]MBP8006809.1 helix-turn-helix transcriptional regulator [Acinetobacter sp.]